MAQVVLLVGFSGQDEVRLFNRRCDRLACSFRSIDQTRPSELRLFQGVGEDSLLIDPAVVGRRGPMGRPEKIEEARVTHNGWVKLHLDHFRPVGEADPSANDPWNTPVQGVDRPESAEPEGGCFEFGWNLLVQGWYGGGRLSR